MFILKAKMAEMGIPSHVTEPIDKVNLVCIIQ